MLKIVIAGRPNAGKSTLFNILASREHTIVSPIAGVTRDAIEKVVRVDENISVALVDCGGIGESEDLLHQFTAKRAWNAVQEADAILFLFDIRGVTSEDGALYRKLHSLKKEMVVVANKADKASDELLIGDVMKLGIPEPILLSCETKKNVSVLRQVLANFVKKNSDIESVQNAADETDDDEFYDDEDEEEFIEEDETDGLDGDEEIESEQYDESDEDFSEPTDFQVDQSNTKSFSRNRPIPFDVLADNEGKKPLFNLTISGKPNAGKSSLLNRLLKKDRSMVSDHAGTTRDSVVDFLDWKGHYIRITDTAGLRKKNVEKDTIESFSVSKAIGAIRSADIVVLLLDGASEEPISEQDKKIASVAVHNNKAFVVVVNKWDLVKDISWSDYQKNIRNKFPHIEHVKILNVSCQTGQNISKLMDTIVFVWENYNLKFPTPAINDVLQDAIRSKAPRQSNKGNLKLLYAVQTEVAPVTFTVFINSSGKMYEEYNRYLRNVFRKQLNIEGVPLIIHYRSRKEQ